VEWAINSFAPYKSPGMEGIFWPCCKRDGRLLILSWSGFFMPAWRVAMLQIQGIWKVVFIPKPGRSSYTGPRDCRPISITSFLLKTMERLVDRFLRDKTLALMPLHPNQHAY
jgi:hypothetical protein